jgi:two-component system phosphate regulon sensor histidine kinase PhoR
VVLAAGLFLIFRNIRKELRLAQNKSEFVSNVSHELRTPLALISMFAETLEMGRVRTEEKKMEYYQIIHKETSRLTGIVNKILTFSQMDADKKEFHLQDTDLNEVIRDILDTYSFHLQQKGFTSHLHDGEEPLLVQADREALQEVLINLLDNAIKYSKDRKEIDIFSGKKEDMAFITVQDYGIGISKEDQKQVFDKFFRVSTGDLAKSKGTGLGLSLVKHIIDQHGGKVTVESTPGQGSSFSIFLPLNPIKNG